MIKDKLVCDTNIKPVKPASLKLNLHGGGELLLHNLPVIHNTPRVYKLTEYTLKLIVTIEDILDTEYRPRTFLSILCMFLLAINVKRFSNYVRTVHVKTYLRLTKMEIKFYCQSLKYQ
jgi:hypothetical protein